jgi:carbon-monoxide dehydrogenase small subunit
VLLDGRLVTSCLVPVAQVAGARVETAAALLVDGRLGVLQQVFLEVGAAQCGICTPGMLLAAEALLRGNPRPGRGEVCQALAGNLCRCTGHTRIVAAVLEAAEERRRGAP